MLHHIADAVAKNHPEMKLIILLVDEHPEEVTDFRRSCPQAPQDVIEGSCCDFSCTKSPVGEAEGRR